jgi:tripartite-type tricarboxylate transporter receptor subunit TctC
MAVGSGLPAWAAQSGWPRHPVRVIVPYPAGGVNDVIARQFGERMAPRWASPSLLKTAAARAAPSASPKWPAAPAMAIPCFGAISPLTLNPHIMKVGYDPLRDIAPVASVMYAPVYVLATTAFKGNDFAAVLDAAKTTPRA